MPGHKSMKKRTLSTRRANRHHKAARKTARAIKQRKGGSAPTITPQAIATDKLKNLRDMISEFAKEASRLSSKATVESERIYAVSGTNNIVKAAVSPEHEGHITDLMMKVDDKLNDFQSVIEGGMDDELTSAKATIDEMIKFIDAQPGPIM